MLTARQQHCLQGIGLRLWRERQAVEAERTESEPLPAVPDTVQPWSAGAIPLVDDVASVPAAGQSSDPEVEKLPAAARAEPPRLENWEDIVAAIHGCEACELSQNCTQKVPGVGNRQADLLIVGEGPGHDEDIRGEPFVGRSGQLLDRMLAAIGIDREQVYITNIVKCRPPNNRDPRADEAQQCRLFLDAQIRQIAPRVILAVGRVSAHNLLDSNLPVGKLIRQTHRLPGTDIPLKVTYHPAYLLRNPSAKSIAWQDMKLLHRLLQ
jgi:uracil-DNA glycosylase